MSKPQEILELEKAYDITLTETKYEDDILDWEKQNCYLLNKKQEVVGLNLRNNEIKEIKNLETLTNLSVLNISDNQISKIENLETLTNLSVLDISWNQISKIENLETLTNLSELFILYNQISKIENLATLTNLSTLYILNNQISKIEHLETLTNLTELDISGNQISKIENLETLTNLSLLNILYNQISKIENLGMLTNLSLLNITDNQISKIEKLETLTNLSELYISHNQISKIDVLKGMLKLPKLRFLTVYKNPFVATENLILNEDENHLDIIKSELQKLEETQIKVQLPVKVMLLGNHASGKSTILTYLQTQQCSKVDPDKNNSTHVLSVVHSKKEINHNLPKAIFYDFGGQDYYHGIYRAFFTQETVNLLAWHPKSNENKLLEKDTNTFATRNYKRGHWLAQLQYAFDKKKTDENAVYEDPILMIQTRADEDSIKENWQEAFLNHHIVDEFHVSLNIDFKSAKNDASLAYLTAAFWETIEKRTSTNEEPEWYPEFLGYILNEENAIAISLSDIEKHYKWKNIAATEKRRNLEVELQQLSRKGMVLYYREDEMLKDVVWLNPAATVKKIHDEILGIGDIKKKGRISKRAFTERKIDPKIAQLLRNEKVLFFDKGNNEYIIPNYLPLTSEDDEVYSLLTFDINEPTFVLKFERFIPFGLINELICHYGQNPDKKQYWRDQLIFTLEEKCKVWIQLDFSKLTISVSIKPLAKDDSIKNEIIQQIFREILFLYWGEKIPTLETEEDSENEEEKDKKDKPKKEFLQLLKDRCNQLNQPDGMYLSIDDKTFVNYALLDNPKTKETIPAYTLTEDENDIDKTTARAQSSYRYQNFTDNPNIQRMKKIFISYSRKDVEYKDELRKHLNMLKMFDVADNWSCEDITIGKWHDQIQKELRESDLVIFMLSINFFNSRYIIEEEVLKTMNEIANGSNKKVYCIIVSEFPSLNAFDNEKLNEQQKDILKLGDYQFGMYVQELNKVTGNKEERIISLKEASRLGILDTQLTKIAEKILSEI